MPLDLTFIELRVLGCLIEKDLSTPEYYPLSLNALVNACNQKSNRDPAMALEEASVFGSLTALRDLGLAIFVSEAGSRVEKYRHRLAETFNFSRPELAILAELMLRGPQTPGELRTRCVRMHSFDDPETVEHSLRKLASREPEALTRQLAIQPGHKERRWMHLLGRETATQAEETPSIQPATPHSRFGAMEAEIASLRQDVDQLKAIVGRLQAALE